MLEFSLSPESCFRIHDALLCLAKFSDSVSIEAREGQLAFTALNSTKSAYVSFVMEKRAFFLKYEYQAKPHEVDQRFVCRVLNKALLSVFKARIVDVRGKEMAIDRCDVHVQDETSDRDCRFEVQMVCKHGVTKNYKLTYEPIEMMHALFDKSRATNRWRIHSRLLREFIEYFGPRTEQLDIYAEDGKVTLTSYTEGITNGKEILKQPLQTSVTVDAIDFEDFDAEEMVHLAISVKDFRNMVIHADTVKTSINAMYSQPSRPLQFAYAKDGMRCEYTLMTIGDFHGTAAPAPSRGTTREPQEPRMSTNNQRSRSIANEDMPPPQRSTTRSSLGHSADSNEKLANLAGSNHDLDPDSLFLPQDDDEQWEPLDQRDVEEDTLGWDANAVNDILFGASFGGAPSNQAVAQPVKNGDHLGQSIEATQRASQVRGIFD